MRNYYGHELWKTQYMGFRRYDNQGLNSGATVPVTKPPLPSRASRRPHACVLNQQIMRQNDMKF